MQLDPPTTACRLAKEMSPSSLGLTSEDKDTAAQGGWSVRCLLPILRECS